MLWTLLPGDVVWPVESGDQAIKKVSATNIGIFGLISYILIKLFGKKKSNDKKEVVEESDTQAEVDDLINSFE